MLRFLVDAALSVIMCRALFALWRLRWWTVVVYACVYVCVCVCVCLIISFPVL